MRNLDLRRSSRGQRLVLALVLFGALAAVGVTALLGSQDASCGQLNEGQIIESSKFTPPEFRRGGLHRPPINPESFPAISVPADVRVPGGTLDGLPLSWAQGGSQGAVYQYFLDRPLDRTMTSWEFFAARGVEFDRNPVGGEDYVAYLLDLLGERAVAVDVGGNKGSLSWADPNEDGLRPHQVTWSDGTFNYSLIADRSAVELVNLARGIVC